MKNLIVLTCIVTLLSGCAVVTTAAVVGATAVSVTTSAVGLTYDATKAVAKGTYAAGEMAVDAISNTPTPQPTSTPQVTPDKTPNDVEIKPLTE